MCRPVVRQVASYSLVLKRAERPLRATHFTLQLTTRARSRARRHFPNSDAPFVHTECRARGQGASTTSAHPVSHFLSPLNGTPQCHSIALHFARAAPRLLARVIVCPLQPHAYQCPMCALAGGWTLTAMETLTSKSSALRTKSCLLRWQR